MTWLEEIVAKYAAIGETVGFILFEASTSQEGADFLHGILSSLTNIGFTGTVGVVAHSNAAVGLFQYMELADVGRYTGDAIINSFVALDAPIPALGFYSGFSPMSDVMLPSAEHYVRSHGTRGAYAASTSDLLAGDYSSDAWDSYYVDAGQWYNQSAHLAISRDPNLHDFDSNMHVDLATE